MPGKTPEKPAEKAWTTSSTAGSKSGGLAVLRILFRAPRILFRALRILFRALRILFRAPRILPQLKWSQPNRAEPLEEEARQLRASGGALRR
jgi:hypothetical protein